MGWLVPKEYCSKSDPLVPSDEVQNGFSNIESGLKEFSLSCLLEDDDEEREILPHFISSAQDIKSIFKLSHNTGTEISLRVNKIGDTLLLSKVKPEAANL